MCVLGLPLFSTIILWCECHGYLRTAHRHVLGWSMVSSHKGACLWNDYCWVVYISLAMSTGLVMTWPCWFCRQSSIFVVVGWKILLWIILGLMLSSVLYLVMEILQLIVVCLVIILWASFFAFFPMVASCSTHVWISTGLVGSGGMLTVWINCRLLIFGLLWRRAWGFLACGSYCLPDVMVYFQLLFPFFLLGSR